MIRSDWYSVNLGRLLQHLADAEDALAGFESLKTKRGSYEAARKRRVIAKLKDAIKQRLSWHKGEIEKAVAAGFSPSEQYEPQMRSIAYPSRRRLSRAGARA